MRIGKGYKGALNVTEKKVSINLNEESSIPRWIAIKYFGTFKIKSLLKKDWKMLKTRNSIIITKKFKNTISSKPLNDLFSFFGSGSFDSCTINYRKGEILKLDINKQAVKVWNLMGNIRKNYSKVTLEIDKITDDWEKLSYDGKSKRLKSVDYGWYDKENKKWINKTELRRK